MRTFVTALLMMSGLWSLPSTASEINKLDAIKAQMVRDQNVAGRFVQDKKLTALPNPLHSEGRFSFTAGERLNWTTETPIVHELIIDKGGLQAGLSKAGQEQAEVASKLIGTLFSAMVEGNVDVLKQYFNIEVDSPAPEWSLVLVPTDELLSIALERVTLSGQQRINSVSILEKSGTITHITLSYQLDKNP